MPRSDLWKCPRCGHRFAGRNMPHSCGNYPLGEHFQGKAERLRDVFDHFVDTVRRFGPVTVYAQKTRIILMRRMRFAAATVRKNMIDMHIVLKRNVDHPGFFKREFIPPGYWVCKFKLGHVEDFEPSMLDLLREAYAVGSQSELVKSAGKRGRTKHEHTAA